MYGPPPYNRCCFAIRDARYKLIREVRPEIRAPELYDLCRDPLEVQDRLLATAARLRTGG